VNGIEWFESQVSVVEQSHDSQFCEFCELLTTARSLFGSMPGRFFVFILILSILFASSAKVRHTKYQLTSDPDMFLNVTQLILSKGYVVEEHQVVTSDGYASAQSPYFSQRQAYSL
jgi:hypothetical protein